MTLSKWFAPAAVALALVLNGASAFAVTIGFSQVGDEGDWRPAFSKDMQVEAKKEGIDLKFADAHGSPEEQLKAVRGFIAAKVDAIIVAPVVVTGWGDVLQEARKAAIPIFLADRDVDVADKSLYVTRIAADYNLEGRIAGAWLAAASRGNCNIVELQGTPGAAPTIERNKGFETVIANFPNMKIVRSVSGDFTTEGGKTAMQGIIKDTDGLNNICASFSHNDNMQLGANSGDEGGGIETRQGHPDGFSRLRASNEGGAGGRRGQCVGRVAFFDRQIHLPGRASVSERAKRPAEVDCDPLRSSYVSRPVELMAGAQMAPALP